MTRTTLQMRRREFIVGISATTWALTARAQPRTIPVVGFLNLGSPNETRSSDAGGPTFGGPTFRLPASTAASAGAGGLDGSYMVAFREGLAQAGIVDGGMVQIDYRWANNQAGRLAPLAAELVQGKVALIVAIDSGQAALAAKAATSTIPIVFALASDPIKSFGFTHKANWCQGF